VPTTAGTGAEVTKNAVVKMNEHGVKRSMRSPYLLAHAVIVDPSLTVSLPLRVTGTSGLDALTQLVESYVSRGSSPPVMSLVEGAFPLMLEALDRIWRDPQDLTQREKASYGALISGIALANAGLGAAHGFAAALGGSYDIPHGLACAVMLPHVLEANAEVIGQRIDKLMGDDGVTRLADSVRRSLSAYDLPADLRSYHIPAESLADLAEKSSGSSMRGNPRDIGLSERCEILARVI
jgi:alcohol dehydrogenase class IV